MAETFYEMVVDHAGRLHQRVACRGADETETEILEGLAHLSAGIRDRRDVLHRFPLIDDGLAADEAPQEIAESVFIITEMCYEDFGIVDGRPYLGLVTNDSGITHQSHHVIFIISGNFNRIETVEGGAIILSPLEYGYP